MFTHIFLQRCKVVKSRITWFINVIIFFFFIIGSILSLCYHLSGGFTYFKSCPTSAYDGKHKQVACFANLKSRHIFAGAGWKCLQFWYYLGTFGFTFLEVTLISNQTRWTAWSSTLHETNVGVWNYARLPIDVVATSYQVNWMLWRRRYNS